MSIRYTRQYSRFVHLCSYLGLLALLLLVFASITHYFELLPQNLFFLFVKISVVCAVFSLFLVGLTLRDMWRYGDKGGLKALRAFTYSCFVILAVGLVFARFYGSAKISYVSTDLNSPPEFLVACSTLMPVGPSMAREGPRRYETSLENIISVITQMAKANHWDLVQRQTGKITLINLKCKDLLTGFISYLVVRIQKENDTVFVDASAMTCGLARDGGLGDSWLSYFMRQLDAAILIDDLALAK